MDKFMEKDFDVEELISGLKLGVTRDYWAYVWLELLVTKSLKHGNSIFHFCFIRGEHTDKFV